MNTLNPIRRVLIIINPASGQKQAVLYTLHRVFAETSIEWDVAVTKGTRNSIREVVHTVEGTADVIAVYGGDGTVTEVANALHGTDIPMAILPGGTANVLATELGVPHKLEDAAQLLADSSARIQAVDMGRTDDQLFFHMSMGVLGSVARRTDRQAKEQNGLFAYIVSGLKELQQLPAPSQFKLTLDDKEVEIESMGCMITNYGKIGVAGLQLAHAVELDDGIMDVMAIRNLTVPTLMQTLTGALATGEIAEAFWHWRAKTVSISTAPDTSMMFDGEPSRSPAGTFTVHVVPGAIRVIVPGS